MPVAPDSEFKRTGLPERQDFERADSNADEWFHDTEVLGYDRRLTSRRPIDSDFLVHREIEHDRVTQIRRTDYLPRHATLSLSGRLDQVRESVNSSKTLSSIRGSASSATSIYYRKSFVKSLLTLETFFTLPFVTQPKSTVGQLLTSKNLVNRLNGEYSASRPNDNYFD